MSPEKIQFRCTDCNKLLAVDSAHAGKLIACPACQSKMRIPVDAPAIEPSAPISMQTTSRLSPTPVPVPTRKLAPAQNPAAASSPVPANARPTAGPSPVGVNKPVPSSKPSPAAPKANPFAPAPADFSSPTSAHSQPAPAYAEPTSEPSPSSPAPSTSLGRSIGGLITAAVVAGVCSILWVIVVAVTSRELGVVAWGIGGAVGLVAGLIARNPSPIFCGLTAGVAVMSMVIAKSIMAATLMVAGMGADFMKDMMRFSPDQQKLSHALVDQMLADGQLAGQEKEYAESFNARFFSGGIDEEMLQEEWEEEQSDELLQLGETLEQKWSKDLEAKSPEQRDALLVAMRARHPEWIEDNNHYLAMVDKLYAEPGKLSEDLSAHAKSELGSLTSNWDSDYHGRVAPNEIRDRSAALKKIVVEAITPLDALQRDQIVRDALKRNPNWMPYNDAYTAMLDKMNTEGKFTGPIAEFAKASADASLSEDGFSEQLEEIQSSPKDFEAKTKELQVLVNQELVSLDASQRNALIDEAQARHPDWVQQEDPMAQVEKIDDALQEIGGDRTFLGCLRSVMGVFDLLWIFLGASTAYGTAKRQAAPTVA